MRILVVDDEHAVRDALRRALDLAGYDVQIAPAAEPALGLLRERPPDAIVLDVLMPGMDGIELCRRLRAGGDRTPVLMLTARDGVGDRVSGLDAGADDYLVKPFEYDELLARIRALIRRISEKSDILAFADVTLDPKAHECRRAGDPIELTAQEFALLEHFMRSPRQVFTRAQLRNATGGSDANPAVRTSTRRVILPA